MLLSGGVDSSVALSLLTEQGHQCTAFYLKVWLEDELAHLGSCPWEDDLAAARQVCDSLGVALEIRSLQKEYWERVVRYALGELRLGRTPSPDIHCNQRIKFGAFHDAIGNGFDRIASGHYARLAPRGGRLGLMRAVDPIKDQSYFLSHMYSWQLDRAMFPIGGLCKPEVRALAKDRGLANQDRPDSQGICFLGKIRYRDFVRHHLGEREGEIVESSSGRVVGHHRGYWFHTIGQRQGLGLAGGPWFVHRKDVDKNIVYVVHKERLGRSSTSRYTVRDAHWLHGPPSIERLQVKLRHGPKLANARVQLVSDGRAVVCLERDDPGVAPGQFTVFYDQEWCLGGASIAEPA